MKAISMYNNQYWQFDFDDKIEPSCHAKIHSYKT